MLIAPFRKLPGIAPWLACWVALALAESTQAAATPGARPKKIVLIAGPIDTHPRETHEYEKNILLIKQCLDTSPDLAGTTVETHFGGWPTNAAALDTADTIFLTSGGSDRQETDHPLYVGDHFAQLEKQMRRGCGIVFFHWSTFHPRRVQDRILDWVGGYFDYESGTNANHWFSAIQTREWNTALASPAHPIARGVSPFKLTEEFYFQLRFAGRTTPVLLHTAGEPGNIPANTVGWAVERLDGGRGFGFTGGHFFKNWWLPDFRRLVLNALAWTAHIEVPVGGVRAPLDDRRRILIVTGANHPAHDWRATTAALLFALEQDPRLIVEVTENPETLASPRLREQALVVLNYCNWERAGLSEAARTNFTRYLSNGGAASVIHFANGAFHFSLPGAPASDWPEYRHIVRRVWDHQGGSGHDAYGSFHVNITDAKPDLLKNLDGFDTVDELYFKQAGVDPITALATAHSKVTGRDEPMAWVHEYGSGRVFQTVLGHSAESVRRAAPLIRRASAWAAGLPPLSFDPPAELLEHAKFRNDAPWKPGR